MQARGVCREWSGRAVIGLVVAFRVFACFLVLLSAAAGFVDRDHDELQFLGLGIFVWLVAQTADNARNR